MIQDLATCAVDQCKNPHNPHPQLIPNSWLPVLPHHIKRRGRSKKWFINNLTGKFIHKDALEGIYKLK